MVWHPMGEKLNAEKRKNLFDFFGQFNFSRRTKHTTAQWNEQFIDFECGNFTCECVRQNIGGTSTSVNLCSAVESMFFFLLIAHNFFPFLQTDDKNQVWKQQPGKTFFIPQRSRQGTLSFRFVVVLALVGANSNLLFWKLSFTRCRCWVHLNVRAFTSAHNTFRLMYLL